MVGGMANEDELIAAYVALDPNRPSVDRARLIGSLVPVWALVGALPAYDHDLSQVADAYDLPLEAVEAAMAFYRKNRCGIDARLAAHDAAFA